MIRHQLFERVPIALARGKKVRCQWLDGDERGKIISQEPRQSRMTGDDTSVCSPCTTSACTFRHAQLPPDEPIAMYPPRGEEEAAYTLFVLFPM